MRTNKEMNAVIDRLEAAASQQQAQIFAATTWLIGLAALHPGAGEHLLSRMSQAMKHFQEAGHDQAQAARCIAALQELNQSLAQARLGIAQEDVARFSPKTTH